MTPDIKNRLLALRDEKYAAFTAKLIPTMAPDRIIGVRAPNIAHMAKMLRGTTEAAEFLSTLPHNYLEENGLHAALINTIKDYTVALAEVNLFLPYVDNWATCDTLSPKCFANHTEDLLPHVRHWIASSHDYTCRFGIGMLMRYYLEPDTFQAEQLLVVAAIRREEYYVRMMQAWYFATALAKQWDSALPIIATLPDWVRHKAIQKAIESRRISNEQKATLRSHRQ